MTEVERFFRRLVSTLAAGSPARLQEPLPLDDIAGTILPYRANRRALQLDTVEDYEAVLLRLCAGEGDLVWTEPEEARKRFVLESRSVNPDLTVLYAFENVQVNIRPEPLVWALAPDPRADYTSHADDTPPVVPAEPVLDLASLRPEPVVRPEEAEQGGADEETAEDLAEPAPPACLYCGGSLPTHRPVNFCPHCGQSQTQILCPECRSEVEPGWRHCVNCGAAVGEA